MLTITEIVIPDAIDGIYRWLHAPIWLPGHPAPCYRYRRTIRRGLQQEVPLPIPISQAS